MKYPILGSILLGISVVAVLVGLVVHYRAQKNAYAERMLAVSNASRYLADHAQSTERGSPDQTRRVLEELLRAFRSLHDTLPKNPTHGWRLALWAPDGPNKLRIIASVDISHGTESKYFMGTEAGCVEGLAWKAWSERSNRWTPDAAIDKDVDNSQHKQTQSPDHPTAIGSLYCQLVCVNENPVGVISIDHDEKDLFSPDDDDVRAAVASLVGICMYLHYRGDRTLGA